MSRLLNNAVYTTLSGLTYREREILKLRTGLGDGYIYTTDEIARIFKVSKSRVLQVDNKLCRRVFFGIKHKYEEKGDK